MHTQKRYRNMQMHVHTKAWVTELGEGKAEGRDLEIQYVLEWPLGSEWGWGVLGGKPFTEHPW